MEFMDIFVKHVCAIDNQTICLKPYVTNDGQTKENNNFSLYISSVKAFVGSLCRDIKKFRNLIDSPNSAGNILAEDHAR